LNVATPTSVVGGNKYEYSVPFAQIVDGVEYTVTVPAGAYRDLATVPNTTALTTWQLNTGDNTAPLMTGNTPINNAVLSTYVNQVLTATFNEAVVPGAGAITINGGAAPIATVVTVDPENANRLFITPATNLDFDVNYTVVIAGNAVQDLAGLNFTQVAPWGFTIVDNEFNHDCLTKLAYSPYDGTGLTSGIPVGKDVNLVINFCERVAPGVVKGIKVYEVDGTSLEDLFGEYTVTSANINGNVVTIPVTGLKDYTTYCVLALEAAVYDENGNKWLGISNPTSWNFTTGDNTQPTATLVPAALTNQLNSFNVGIEFSENVVDVAANVTVSEGTVVVTGSGKTYNAAITANDLSSVVLTVGIGIKDESGRNNLASAVTGTYVVGDNTKPTIVTVAGPAAPITTSFTVGLTFNEAVTGVANAITVSNNATLESVTGSGANWVVKIKDAAEEGTVNINVGNTIVDGNNNTFAGQVINYTIGDWTRPVVEQHSDQLSDNNTAQDFIVTLTFSADANVTPADIMVIGASNFTVNALGGNVFAANISAEDLSTVTVVASSSIADEAGNLLTGETTASYVVGDNTAPTLVAVPAAGSNNTNAFEVILNFSEAVVIPANAITVTNGTLVGIETISGSKYSVTLSGDDNTTVELHVPGTVTDLAGNNFTGATFAYSIGDNTAPLVIDVTPDTNVPQQMNFIATFTFNEPVFGFAEGITILNAGTPVIAKEGNSYAVMIDAIQEGDVTVQLDENIVDANGNALVPVQYVFTADKTAPVVAASSTQTANNTLNEFDISLVFTEPVVNVLEGVVVTGTTFSETTQVTPSLYTIHVKGNDGASIKVTVPTTIEDLAGNKLANEASFTYSIGDNTAPVIVSVVPESGDKMTNTFNVVITFSEPVINVPANVSVTNGTVAVTGSGAVYTAAITAIDHANVALTIATGIKDASDRNALAAGSTNNYTIGDNTKPTATLSALADPQATVFTVNVNFSEDVVMPAEGGITVTGATKSVVTKVNDSRYSVEITAAEEATVVVNANNTITDAAGNALVPATASYKVGDFTAPTVVADPASGEKMQNSFTVKLTFSDDAIVTANDIMVNGATAVNKTNVGNVYSVALTAADYANVSIMVANTIKDEAKNAITGNLLFNYTVADNTPPVISVDPVSAKDTVAVFDLTLVFSESVTIPAGAISVNSPATIKVEPLSNGKVYKATISGQDNTTVTLTVTDAIVDQAGNKLANGTFTYTIGDHSVPTVKITPAGGATNLNKDFSVDLVFSEAVTGVATGVEVTGGVATVTGSGTTYKVAIASKDMTTVVLKLKNTIADLAGNKIAEVTQVYNTGDFTAPVVTVPASTSVNNITGTVPVTSNEVGVAFIAKSDVAANQAAIVAAIAANKAKQAPVVTASTAVEFSAAGLVAGTYKAYAIDAAGNIGTAVNTFEVTDVPMLAIKAIQGEGAASPYAGKVVATKGVVTALQADKKGYFIQDANEAYGGIFIYDNQLKGNVQLGTAIKVVGTVNEYYELTQIKDLIAVEYIAPMVTPAPIVVNVADVAKEQYEGVLVTVEGVAVNALPDANKEWKIMKPIGTTVLVDDQFYPYTPVIDHHYDVTGVVNYTYNFYKIAPRIVTDIVDLTITDVTDLATSVKVYPNPFDKFIKLEVSSDVTITKAVITNMAGQKIKEVINPDNTIPTSELRSGVYFISLHTEDGIAKTERIIKR